MQIVVSQDHRLLRAIPAERYQIMKKNWMPHGTSWTKRGLDKHDGDAINLLVA
ncbi:MAG TPA: hypothetical protein VFI70_10135 [Nitrososphaeraceae archaeon]|nr:hypothetical protein [Nitrososphaeraceae archaeon]